MLLVVYIDDVALEKIVSFEGALLDYMKTHHAEFMATVNTECVYNDDVAETFKKAIEAFKKLGTY